MIKIKTISLQFLLLLALLLNSCASPMSTLKKGNYNKAYKQASNQLKRGKSVKENKKVLVKSLTKIIEEGNRDKSKLLESDNIEDLIKAYKINEDLQSKMESAFAYIDDEIFKEEYMAQREEGLWMRKEIANAYFDFGKSSLDEAIDMQNKKQAREAYDDFGTAKRYGYKGSDIDSLIEQTIIYGRQIYTVEAEASFGINMEWKIDRRFEDVEDYSDTFLKIYFERLNIEGVDCHLEVDFNSIDFDYSESSNQESFTQRVQTGTTTVTDADGNVSEQPVFANVQAQVNITRRIKVATWEASVRVRSRSRNCELSDERFRESIGAEIEFITFTGDERAVPARYRSINNDRLPEDDEMAEELLDIIYGRFLREYF